MEKKKQAALAAVLHYLDCEKAAQAEAETGWQQAADQGPARMPDGYVSPWAFSGRQAQMQMRTMVQMKVF